jgi:hypothetical protein
VIVSKLLPKIQLPLLVFYLALLSGILVSCSILDFTPMNVELHPSQADTILAATDPIQVDFSFDIQRSTAESITSILFNGQPVPVDYVWSGNTVSLQPQALLNPGARYVLQVSGTVTAQNGSLKTITDQVPFYYEFMGSPPSVSSTTPSAGGNLDPRQSLVVFFSQAIDPATLAHGLSLSPSTPYTSSWSPDATVLTLSPQTTWTSLATLTLSLSTDLRSLQGQALSSAWTGHYEVQDGLASPFVTAAQFYSRTTYQTGSPSSLIALNATSPTGQDLLGLSFNAPVDFKNFTSQAQIVPQTSGHWETLTSTFFLFLPDQGWNMASSYLLSVPSLRTIGGTASAAPYTFSWSTTSTIPPQNVSLTLNGSGIDLVVPPGDSANPPSVAVGATDQLVVTLDFAQTISQAYETSLASSSLVTPVLPLSASSAQLINLTFSGTKLVLTYDLVPPPAGQAAVYKIVIPGGTASINSTGSYLTSATLFLFRVVQE